MLDDPTPSTPSTPSTDEADGADRPAPGTPGTRGTAPGGDATDESGAPAAVEAPADEPAPRKKAVRRRATKATAAAPDAPVADSPAVDAPAVDTPAADAPTADAPTPSPDGTAAGAEAPAAVPVKRTRARKAPAKAAAKPAPEAAPEGTVAETQPPAAPADVLADATAGTPDPVAGPTGETAPAETAPGGAAPAEDAPPAKRAPRKRATRKAAAPTAERAEPTAALPAEAPPATAVEAAEAAADGAEAGELAATDLPATAAQAPDRSPDQQTDEQPEPVAASTPEPASAPAEAAAEPATPRTRRRRAPAVVTFVAPDEAPHAAAAATAPAEPVDAAPEPASEAPAPRRRRRAGTAGAVAPGDLLPTLLAPEPGAEPVPATGPAAADEADDDEDGDRPRRRRRGRRGRGPRRDDETAEVEDTPDGDPAGAVDPAADRAEDEAAAEDDDEAGEPGEAADGESATRRRRRRRRRSGASGEESADDDVATVVHVREPRPRAARGTTAADEDGVRGITGSTRMAAKRVRRQEGRDSGRRRAPVLTEAEFLARREAVERSMIVRQKGDVTQVAVLEDGILVEHFVTKASAQSYAGNIYLGRVQNVLPSMEAAFVDIGKGRNGVLYAGEVNYEGAGRGRSIESVLKSGQEVLVQVSKDPIGHKGARLTSQVSLPGRYLVYVPEGSMTGISRKLPENERARLKSILKKVVPDTAGVIIRTAAEGASEEEIAADVRRLQAQWEVVQEKAKSTGGGGAPKLLQAEPDLVVRVVRDVFNEDFTSLVVQGDSEWDTIRDYVEFVAPDLADRVRRHTSDKDVFAEHRIDEQLLKALDRKVYLPSGGSLVIDRTEAMVVIDVNTGKYVGKGGNLEETVTRNNLEAAEEIARQLRLRDLGGIIVVDFIDMVLESNRDLVVRRLVECLGRDRTKHQVAEVTSLGLVQMTRKRVGQGLLESFSEPCESCGGRGVHVRTDSYGSPMSSRSPVGDPENTSRMERVAKATKRAEDPAAGPDDDAPAEPSDAPRRRRRGGRGRGAATVSPQDELDELLVEPAGSEVPPPLEDEPVGDAGEEPPVATDPEVDAVADAPAPVASDPAAGSAPDPLSPDLLTTVVPVTDGATAQDGAPDLLPDALLDLADQPTPAEEDLPVLPEIVASVRDEEPAGLPEGQVGPVDGPAGQVDGPAGQVDGEQPAEADGSRPRRRRRATSRPAGPPQP